MASLRPEIRQQTFLIADLHIKLGQHRRTPIPDDRKWKRQETNLVQRLAQAYAKLAKLKAPSPILSAAQFFLVTAQA